MAGLFKVPRYLFHISLLFSPQFHSFVILILVTMGGHVESPVPSTSVPYQVAVSNGGANVLLVTVEEVVKVHKHISTPCPNRRWSRISINDISINNENKLI